MPKTPIQITKTHAPDPTSRRASELVASLRAGDITDVFETFAQLDALPVEEVSDAFTAWRGPLPDPDQLDPATRRALHLPLRPLRLRVLSVANDADILDLGEVAEAQLRFAGKSWDGRDLPAEERLDGEIEGSFAGTVERRVLGDADAPGDVALFDVLLFAEDSGVVFAAGTTSVVALIAYGTVEMRDRRTRVALEAALATPGPVTAIEEPTEQSEGPADGDKAQAGSPSTKPRARPKTAAKKTAKKTTVAKKTAKKTTVTQKTAKKTAKKTQPKKTAKKATKRRLR